MERGIILADYEGLGVAIAQLVWLFLTIPAILLAVGGIVSSRLAKWRPTLGFCLGATACVVEIAAVVIVCLAFADEQARLGDDAKRFRPGFVFWLVSATTLSVGAAAPYLVYRRRVSPERPAAHL